MAAQQQGQPIAMPEEKGQKHKRTRRVRFIIACVFLLFAISAVILILHGTFLGSWSNILIVFFSVLGIVIAFAQWFFPISSEPATTHSSSQRLSSTTPQIILQVPPTITHPPVQPSFRDKTATRNIIGVPPPTDPRSIQQREKVVQDIYAKLTQPDISAIVLTGIGGVGKSTLAALVYNYIEEQRLIGNGPFTAEPLWLRVDPAVTMVDLTGTLIEALGRPLPDLSTLSPQTQAVVLFNVLNTVDKPRLVILDQFENLLNWQTGHALPDCTGVGEWLDALNSQRCTCRVLLTSRLWPRGTHEYPPTYMQEYPVKGLEVVEGIELLRKQGVKATEAELHAAIERCDGHALALTLLASLLRRNRSLSLSNFFKDSMYTQLWTGDIARNLLDYTYTMQLDEVQRKLLLAFSIYREAVPLDAAQWIMTDMPKARLVIALDVLLVQHLLQATGSSRYQLHAIVADYAQGHFGETSEEANQQTLRTAHFKAALYYLSLAAISCPPREQRHGNSDVHPLLEAAWHQCHAGKWQDAYNLMEKEGIFEDLKRWGGNGILLELYLLLLPLDKWHPKTSEAICIYNNLGRLYRTLGQRDLAKDYCEKALEICVEKGERKAEGSVRSYLGSVYADLGQTERAHEELGLALKIRREIRDREGEGWTLSDLGRIYDELGQEERAQEYCQQSLEILREVGNRRGEGRTLNILGRVYDNLGQKQQACIYYEQALSICKEIGDRLGEGLTLNGLGLVYADLGQWEEALQYLERALDIRREVGDRGGEGRSLINLGRIYRILGQRRQAWEYLVQALGICNEIGDRLGEGKIFNNMGLIYFDQHNHEQALEHLNRALSICEEIGDRSGEGWALHNLGLVYEGLRQTERAQECYERALGIRKEVGDRRGVGWTLHNIGLLYFHQHQYEVALAALSLAKRIFEEVQSPAYVKAQDSINDLREEIGEEQFTVLLSAVIPRANQIVEQALLERVS